MTEDIAGKPETFDLIAAIEGTTHPTEEVQFLFDERAAQTVANLEDELKRLAMLGKNDEYEELDKIKTKLIASLKDSIYTVTVKGISRKVKKAILKSVEAKHPDKANAFGQAEPNYDGIEYYHTLQWQAHINKIAAPDGSVKNGPLTEGEVTFLLDNGPEISLSRISAAIDSLETGPKSGYDQIVQELGFLSEPSRGE